MKLNVLMTFFALAFLFFIATQNATADNSKVDTLLADIKSAPALVLFYRQDCAPCQLEMNMLPRIREAAGDWPVILVALSKPDKNLKAAGVEVIDASKADAKKTLSQLNNNRAALPFSIALDKTGKICGKRSGILGLDIIKKWKTTCSK